ncbi:MAG: hypothetical protein IJA34_10730 [Lachnospiraceae bacterium]|nr:hypothetical protein [Lachnospiraceae bacterium]
MIEFDKLPYFEEYIDEESGVKSYILNKKPAEFVQSFYFTNQSLSEDNKYLWMYCFYPPLKQHCLGVVSLDPKNTFVRVFNQAVFSGASPLVAPEGDKVYFTGIDDSDCAVYTIDLNGNIELFAKMDNSFIDNKLVTRFSTHLTISADGKYMLIDAMFVTYGFVTILDMKTREFKIINEYQNFHNHAQFSPVHPNLFLLSQDSRCDPVSGKWIAFKNRIWLCDTEATLFEPVIQRSWHGHDGTMVCHDFWSQDGKICWIDYKKGAYEMDVDTSETNHIWKEPLCHAHCNVDRSLWVADQSPYDWPKQNCKVMFLNRSTGKKIDIFSAMPAPRCDKYPAGIRSRWHIDPHPQFTKDGENIICTTTVKGGVDIAITPVKQLIDMT